MPFFSSHKGPSHSHPMKERLFLTRLPRDHFFLNSWRCECWGHSKRCHMRWGQPWGTLDFTQWFRPPLTITVVCFRLMGQNLNKYMSSLYSKFPFPSYWVDTIASNDIITIFPKTLHSAVPVWTKIPGNWYLKIEPRTHSSYLIGLWFMMLRVNK